MNLQVVFQGLGLSALSSVEFRRLGLRDSRGFGLRLLRLGLKACARLPLLSSESLSPETPHPEPSRS